MILLLFCNRSLTTPSFHVNLTVPSIDHILLLIAFISPGKRTRHLLLPYGMLCWNLLAIRLERKLIIYIYLVVGQLIRQSVRLVIERFQVRSRSPLTQLSNTALVIRSECSTLAIHLPVLAQIEKEIDTLTRHDTDNSFTDDLTYLLTYFLVSFLVIEKSNERVCSLFI